MEERYVSSGDDNAYNKFDSNIDPYIEWEQELGWIAQVGYDEAYPGEQFSLMPLYLDYHSPRNIPTLGLVGEVVIRDDGLSRGPLGRPYQQMRYFPLKHLVSWKPYGIANAFKGDASFVWISERILVLSFRGIPYRSRTQVNNKEGRVGVYL